MQLVVWHIKYIFIKRWQLGKYNDLSALAGITNSKPKLGTDHQDNFLIYGTNENGAGNPLGQKYPFLQQNFYILLKNNRKHHRATTGVLTGHYFLTSATWGLILIVPILLWCVWGLHKGPKCTQQLPEGALLRNYNQ